MWGQRKKLAQAAKLWASGQLNTDQSDAQDDTATDALAIWGLVADDGDTPPASGDTFNLWPECVPVWLLWQKLQTQWRVGMNGRDGLDYAGVAAYLRDVARIKPRAFVETFFCIQAMEVASLNEWARQARENKKGSP